MLSRRGLITGLVSFMAAPAIVRASSLMPVKALIEPPIFIDEDLTWGGEFVYRAVALGNSVTRSALYENLYSTVVGLPLNFAIQDTARPSSPSGSTAHARWR